MVQRFGHFTSLFTVLLYVSICFYQFPIYLCCFWPTLLTALIHWPKERPIDDESSPSHLLLWEVDLVFAPDWIVVCLIVAIDFDFITDFMRLDWETFLSWIGISSSITLSCSIDTGNGTIIGMDIFHVVWTYSGLGCAIFFCGDQPISIRLLTLDLVRIVMPSSAVSYDCLICTMFFSQISITVNVSSLQTIKHLCPIRLQND